MAKRDALKYRGNNGHHQPGHTFIPASVETYGYLGKPIVRYLKIVGEVAAARGPAVTQGSFLAGAHCELTVALIKCQGSMYRCWLVLHFLPTFLLLSHLYLAPSSIVMHVHHLSD